MGKVTLDQLRDIKAEEREAIAEYDLIDGQMYPEDDLLEAAHPPSTPVTPRPTTTRRKQSESLED